MDIGDFFGLRRGDEPLRWSLDIGDHVVTPNQFLFGGCGLGAALVALEATSERPVIWATAQYLSYAMVGSTLDLDVELAAIGQHVTQARATGRVSGREVFTVNAALGTNDFHHSRVWVEAPVVPPPEQCPPRRVPVHVENSIFHNVETRLIWGRNYDELDGRPGSPLTALWARLPGHFTPSAGLLAIYGDYLTGGVASAVGLQTMGRSLDNTIRMVAIEETEWVLCELRLDALVNGYAQGIGYLWSETGTLLATASQSLSVKLWS
jgi:acyl-CoA thioesterase II